jgi:hypothetical protein
VEGAIPPSTVRGVAACMEAKMKKKKKPIKPDYSCQFEYLQYLISMAEIMAVNKMRAGFDDESEVCLIARRKVVKARIKEILKDVEWLKEEYQEELFGDDKWPRKWMIKDKKIKIILQKTRLADVLNYLEIITTKEETNELSKHLPPEKRAKAVRIKSGSKEGKTVKRDFVLFTISKENAGKYLKMSPSSVQKYIKKFADLGIIKDLGKPGPNSPKIYAYGTWLPFGQNQMRRNHFLQETSIWKMKLREFLVR